MSLAFFNFKGGTGKTGLASFNALSRRKNFVTNDMHNLDHVGFDSFTQLDDRRKRIPETIRHSSENVYDLGAMNGRIDFKVIDALKHSEAVVIPTLMDVNSIQATIESIREAREYVDVIIVVINRVRQKNRRYRKAFEALSRHLPESHILTMKETTLFERLAEDGSCLLENVGHKMGVGRLNNTIVELLKLFDRIDELIVENTRIY